MLDSLELEFETGATQCEYWDVNSGPLQEQKALLTTAFFFFLIETYTEKWKKICVQNLELKSRVRVWFIHFCGV